MPLRIALTCDDAPTVQATNGAVQSMS